MKIHATIPQIVVDETRIAAKGGGYKKQQTVLLHIEGRLSPLETSVILNDDKPYPIGVYELDPGSFYAGKYGRTEFGVRLGKQLQAPTAKAA